MLYNNSMKTKLTNLAKELLQPFFDQLVDTTVSCYLTLVNNLPADMPDDAKLDIVKGVIENQSKVMINGIKQAVPEDFEQQIKEAYNGGK